jgi:diguanylate cyclase (GGDEF)-like protein
LVASVGRIGIFFVYRRQRLKRSDVGEARRWACLYGVGAVALGLLMGAINFEAFQIGGSLAFVPFGWAMATAVGATARTATVPLITVTAGAAILLPTATAALLQPDWDHRIAGIFALVTFYAVIQGATYLHEAFVERLIARHELARRLHRDDLTGLANRPAFLAELEERTEAGSPDMLIYLDLDRFKEVNDTFGHATGDAVLIEVASRLRKTVGLNHHVARLGGDEFALIMRSGTGDAEAWDLAQRLVEDLGRPYLVDQVVITCVGVSVGLARGSAADERPDRLIAAADEALYSAKRAGRGRWKAMLFEEAA